MGGERRDAACVARPEARQPPSRALVPLCSCKRSTSNGWYWASSICSASCDGADITVLSELVFIGGLLERHNKYSQVLYRISAVVKIWKDLFDRY